MGPHAVALLRVKSRDALLARVASARLPSSAVRDRPDGSVLLHTPSRFGKSHANTLPLRMVVAHLFGEDLPNIHDDPRGVLIFSDSRDPKAETYDGVIDEIGAAGVWVRGDPLSEAEMRAYVESIVKRAGTPRARLAKARPKRSGRVDLDALAEQLGLEPLGELVTKAPSIANADFAVGCLLLRTPSALELPLAGAKEVHRLPDGTHVVVTTSTASAPASVEWDSWIGEHSDPRGVLFFSAAHLEEILACSDYASAVARARTYARWIAPKR
jgi:hypothetical protein